MVIFISEILSEVVTGKIGTSEHLSVFTRTQNKTKKPLIRANREDLPTTVEFTYRGNTIRHDEGTNEDIKNRLVKAINVVRMLSREVPAVEH